VQNIRHFEHDIHLKAQLPSNKALQRTRLKVGCSPWRFVRAAELGR